MSRNGTYEAAIHNWDLGMSKNSDPMLLIEFQCLPPANKPDMMPFDGSTYIVFSESAMDWAFRKLEAIGYEGDTLDALDPANPPSKGGAHDFAGKKIRVKVEETEEEYNGKKQVRLNCDIVIPTRIKARVEDRDRETIEDINVRLAYYRMGREAKKAAEAPKTHVPDPNAYLTPAGVNGTEPDSDIPF